jgi:hypothetical protein
MQHVIIVLAMVLLPGIAGKELSVAKVTTNNRLMQIEKVQAAKAYELPDVEEDNGSYEFNVGSCYTDLFQ